MKTVVFVRHNPYPRMYNQAYALKKTGRFRTVLLCRDFDESLLDLFRNVFDEIICYMHPLLDIKRYDFKQKTDDLPIVHTFKVLMTDNVLGPFFQKLSFNTRFYKMFSEIDKTADVYNCCGADDLTNFVLRNTIKPVVMDLHNGSILRGIRNLVDYEKKRDKYCFENVDGIIYRGNDFEINYYKNHQYDIKGELLHYFDYCNKDFFVKDKIKKLSSEDSEYHLVSIGSGIQSPYMINMIQSIISQKVHFHMYLVPYSTVWNVYSKYYKMNKDSKYFHLHDTIPFDSIQNEIAKYDFGTILKPIEFINTWSYASLEVADRCYRHYTFFEAGLPIIINKDFKYLCNIITSNKVGFGVNTFEYSYLDEVIDEFDYDVLKRNVVSFRNKWVIDNHVERLNNFYDKINYL